MTIPKVRIHMSTLKSLAEVCRSDNRTIEFVCSVRTGRVLAYPNGTTGISPGSWCCMYDELYPLWKDGKFVGTMHHNELSDYSDTFNRESSLEDVEDKILYEVVVVPDDEPEDLSEIRR